MSSHEPVRLVIWDLDETFWQGTLGEGGITRYCRRHHDIVIALAKRGIISSICSKNDWNAVEDVLKEQAVWDYFVLPSIDWTAKGPRLKQLVEDIQLRPESVLFIDDNPGNRAEAAAHVPGLRVADIDIIDTLLESDLCRGKSDPGLSRLTQYRLLERRKVDQHASASNVDFLRSSHIHVAIEPNIAAHLDRAIELINRTNQLNFTRLRLPDDIEGARAELIRMTSRYCYQAGLIRVWDDYGDHGFCGFYVMLTRNGVERLRYFCFSCRILGMGVERWLYKKLGRPELEAAPERAVGLQAGEPVDWINQEIGGGLLFVENIGAAPLPAARNSMPPQWLAPEIRLRGGCDLDALSHYLRQEAPTIVMETNLVDGAFLIRRDCVANIALSLTVPNPEMVAEIDRLSLFKLEADRAFFDPPQPGTLFILSAWADLYLPVYRHKRLGFEISVALRIVTDAVWDLTRSTDAALDAYFASESGQDLDDGMRIQVRRISGELAANYTCIGRASPDALLRRWRAIFAHIPRDCAVAVILPVSDRGDETVLAQVYHAILRQAASGFPHVALLDPTPHVTASGRRRESYDHLDRMVYFSMYKDLMRHFGGGRLQPRGLAR